MCPEVSVIVLTKNAGERFEDVLAGVERQSTDLDVEHVVVDSGSTDATVERAREFGWSVHHIDPEEFHHGRTRNLGAEQSSGDVLVYLTHDAVPRSASWLDRLVSPVRSGEAAAAYGRQIAHHDARPMDEFFYSYFYPDRRRVLTAADARDPRQFYLDNVFVSDVSAAIDRAAWERFRFRDSVPMSEDKDFALRVLEDGDTVVYEPSAAVYHSHDYDLPAQFRRRYADGRAYARIASQGGDTFASDGLAYVAAELRYLVSNGHAAWLPYALAYDFAHFLGFECGKHVGRYAGLGSDQ
jgi:rhamnosyltransferase